MSEFIIPLQVPLEPYDPTTKSAVQIIASEYRTPVQVFLSDKELWELQKMYPQDPEFERQRTIQRAKLHAVELLLNLKNNSKLQNYITNHVRTKPTP